MAKKHSIVVLIPYFGKWPSWIELFFETLRRNPTIDFLIYTDCETSIIDAPNIRFKEISFDHYIEFLNKKLDFKFKPQNAYKLCDFRPLFGCAHEADFEDYDFYGWCDLDLFFGNIREFYTDDLLSQYDVFSTRSERISGHFALFRNNERNRKIYKNIYQWKEALQHSEFVGIDEHGITNAYTMTVFDKINEKFGWKMNNLLVRFFSRVKKRRLFLKEQYTTPFISMPWLDGSLNSEHPNEWLYRDGVITNQRDGDRHFIYIHFMNFKSSQWRHDGTPAPWENKKQICFASASDMSKGIKIDANGIFPQNL